MCRTYNMIGSLRTIKAHLKKNHIHDFKSLKDVMSFQNSFETYKQQLIAQHQKLIQEEKNILQTDLQELDATIETQKQQSEQRLRDEIDLLRQQLHNLTNGASASFFKRLVRVLRQWNYKAQINRKKRRLDIEVIRSIEKLLEIQKNKQDRFQFIDLAFDSAVNQSAGNALAELERKKGIIDGLNSFIYGALGEQKVVKTLEALSDDYHLINDFALSFYPAMHNKQENDFIRSIQIDHLLVAPSGIFLIETKNWSDASLENLNLRSPVQQIRRTSFVLFKLLNNELSNHHLRLGKHHWGNKKVSLKNLIVLTNTKPKEEFQFVKVLTLNQLSGYINYFKPVLSADETTRIAEFLIAINDRKVIKTK